MNLYVENNIKLLTELADRRKSGESFNDMRLKYLKLAWFALVESTGGGANASIESDKKEEIALYHIEKAIEQFI